MIAFISANAQPTIKFDQSTHDFKTIKEDDGVAETTFKVTNDGDQPLIINNVRTTCGCTSPEWTREPIAPGKTGFVKVGYNPRNRPGAFSQRITVYSNTQPAVSNLTITGTVTPRERTVEERFPRVMGPVRWASNFASMGTITNKESKTEELSYINTSDKAVKIDIYRSTANVSFKFEPETVEPGKEGKMFITYDASKKDVYGLSTDRAYLTINGERESSYSIQISANIQEDFSSLTEEELKNAPVAAFEETVFDFGTIKQGEKIKHDFVLKNNGKSDLIIRRVRTSCGCTAVKHSDVIKPGESTKLSVEFNSRGKRSRQNQAVTVITNDPKTPSTVLRVMGVVDAS
jgi:hypothetical protein